MTTLEIIRLVGTEFDDVPDETLEQYIELYADLLSKKKFGSFYEKALAFLICHKMKMRGLGSKNISSMAGSVGDTMRVASMSEGATSISFKSNESSVGVADAEYEMTSYGIEFLNLRSLCIIPIVSAGWAQ